MNTAGNTNVEPPGRVVAIIPARGGSKGIPRKNLVELAGKPLIVHTIEHARATPEIDETVVTTDDPDIAAVSQRWGATVVTRPAALSGDEASSESALLHALDVLYARDGKDPDLIVFLQATSPLRPAGATTEAIEQLVREGADSLFSACAVHGFVWRVDGDTPVPVTYDYRRRPRRQDAAEHLEENGSIYVLKPGVLRRHGNRLGGRIAVFRMDPLFSFQIDTPADVDTARVLAGTIGTSATAHGRQDGSSSSGDRRRQVSGRRGSRD